MFEARPWKVKGLNPVVKRYRVRRDGGPEGVAMPPDRRTGPSYMRGGVVACPKRRHASPGCAPLTEGAAADTWRGKRTLWVYIEGILLWLCPVCCSKVFLWADLTQPGGEFHWSKLVRAKSKG